MRHIRIVMLSLVAVFALCAVAASSASATEVLFKLPSGSSYPVLFSSKAGAALLETEGGTKIKCTAVTNHGFIENAHLGSVEILFTGCTTKVLFTLNCQNGSTTGDIHLANAVFHLGLAHVGGEDKPAILFLLPVNGSGEHEFTFECGGSSVKVTGDVIGLLEKTGGGAPPFNEPVENALVSFTQSKGKQNTTEFLLSLTEPENELMTGQSLTSNSELFGVSGSAEQVDDELYGFGSKTIELVHG